MNNNYNIINDISPEEKAKELILNTNTNVFIQGRAGTGKSYFLTEVLKKSLPRYNKKAAFLAPTGLAAKHIGGRTLHSFMGSKDLVGVDIIIVDEVSMVRADVLDKLDMRLREKCRIDIPFAGKQMVFVGDLYQLPPVVAMSADHKSKAFENPFPFSKEDYLRCLQGKTENIYDSPFFLSANCIRQSYVEIIEFTDIKRQNDKDFIELLNRVSINKLDYRDLNILNSRKMPLGTNENDGVYLTANNKLAQEYNEQRLKSLGNTIFPFVAEGYPNRIPDWVNIQEPKILRLAVGARVMITKNDSSQQRQYVNGNTGIVKEIICAQNPQRFIEEKSRDTIIVQLDRNGENVYIPCREIEVREDIFDGYNIKGNTIKIFKQFPLKLAWALTIHKSQGQTYDKIILDLGPNGAFENGQAYVALSRCRTFEGINLVGNITENSIRVSTQILTLINIQKRINEMLAQKSHYAQRSVSSWQNARII